MEATTAKGSDEAPEAPPPKQFTLRDTISVPEHESVTRVKAEQAKWRKVFALILGKITRANDPS